ncbi:hypothetical protein VZ94_09765 [Methylocucumis oryzae]|uniref:Uncharacterized protein n=1 Tax=Methylocucumis oryzae TaxID=1632867 RepID=A0A0F3IIV2_9GAMM|nr:tetratricopeptide repeat protein [Methylocucumis oryzae]KJV06680.1 hypothetical protein VZ94_09765 [Methylocucumis oryzae]
MDFDLEAPGLLHFQPFQPKSGDKRPAGFSEYIALCLEQGPPSELNAFIHECCGKETDQGKTWIMPAGRDREPGYLAFLNTTTWADFYNQQDGYKILENLRGHIIAEYEPDYVFIDARTGLSEVGGIATHQLADIVVLVFNLNEQNLVGAKRVFDSICSHAPLKPELILVASPIPVMPVDKATPFGKKMQRIKRDFNKAYNAKKPVVIPYHPLLAYEDRLLVDDGDLFSSDAPYRRLTELIQKVAQVDEAPYLQQLITPLQKSDWKQVIDIAQKGVIKHPTSLNLLNHLSRAYFFSGDYEKALMFINQTLLNAKATDNVIKARLLMLKGSCLEQLEKTSEQIAAYDEVIQCFGQANEVDILEQVAKALFNKGFALGKMQQLEAEIAVYDELVQRFGQAQEIVLLEPVAKALINKGAVLGKMQQPEAEIAVYSKLLQHFGQAHEIELLERVAKALINKGVVLEQMQQPEAAIAVYDELLQRFGQAHEIAILEQVAKALYNKGVVLGQMQQLGAALAVYDELLQRFSQAHEIAILEPIAKALYNKGVVLGQMQQPEAAITVYDELLQRFGQAHEIAILESVAKTLYNKGVTLTQIQQPEAASAVYNDLIKRFSTTNDPMLQQYACLGLNSIGFALLIEAKKHANSQQRLSLFEQSLEHFEQALHSAAIDDQATILGNQAYALFLLHRKDECRAVLQAALKQGGQALYDEEKADSQLNELPEDTEFRALLDEVWQSLSAQQDFT